MMRKVMITLMLLVCSLPLHALPPLVDSHWVQENANRKNTIFLDIQEAINYRRIHLPGAINAPYSFWRTGEVQPPKGMLPKIDALERWIGSLGISNNDTVVISAMGISVGDMAASARVFWTFRILGHDGVTILNGGLAAWANSGGKLENTVNQLPEKVFSATLNKSLLADKQDVKAALQTDRTLVDARSVAEYLGIYQASPEERPGTIPGSKNLPYEWMTVNGSGQIHSSDRLKKLFIQRGIVGDKAIHYCHTGNRASLTWFIDYALLGNKKAQLYDASTKEWARDSSLPVTAEIDL
jgi:thiosulfate/3-mercaptopyruvate sulfurtransferase